MAWTPVPENASRFYLPGFVNASPETTVNASLQASLAHPFVTAEIVKRGGDDGIEYLLDCSKPPVFKVGTDAAVPVARNSWIIGRKVLAYRKGNIRYPCRHMWLMGWGNLAVSGAGVFQVMCSGGSIEIRVIKTCSKWDKLRKLAPKVGRIALTVTHLHDATMEKTYAPGGAGFERARKSFHRTSKRKRR